MFIIWILLSPNKPFGWHHLFPMKTPAALHPERMGDAHMCTNVECFLKALPSEALRPGNLRLGILWGHLWVCGRLLSTQTRMWVQSRLVRRAVGADGIHESNTRQCVPSKRSEPDSKEMSASINKSNKTYILGSLPSQVHPHGRDVEQFLEEHLHLQEVTFF